MVAILLALAAAASVAIASALQHRAATGENEALTGRRLIRRLWRKPTWLVGLGFAGLGFALHGLALRTGRLGVIQPLLVTSVIFALPLRAAIDRRRPSVVEVAAAALLAAALAGFLLAANRSHGTASPAGGAAAILLAVGGGAAVVLSIGARRTRSGTVGGVLLGAATGLLYGLLGGALKATVHQVASAPAMLVTTWPLWTLLVVGVWGFVLNQRAYAHAPLRVSLPVLLVLNPVVGVVFGAFVFGEKPIDSVGAALVQVTSLLVVAGSIAVLAGGIHPRRETAAVRPPSRPPGSIEGVS